MARTRQTELRERARQNCANAPGTLAAVLVVLTFADGASVTVELPEGVTEAAARAAAATLGCSFDLYAGPARVKVKRTQEEGEGADGAALWASLTRAESGVLTELAHRPDTRSRLAARLGITPSTLDNHLAAIKRKLLEHLKSAGQGPQDGYLSTEMVIGWAARHIHEQKS